MSRTRKRLIDHGTRGSGFVIVEGTDFCDVLCTDSGRLSWKIDLVEGTESHERNRFEKVEVEFNL